jgi:glutamyl endopeptidase
MRGYRGDARKLVPGEFDDARASIRNGSAEADLVSLQAKRDIIGSNDLIIVDPTTDYPARAVAKVWVKFKGKAQNSFAFEFCSGFLISKDTIATSGSCVYNFSRFPAGQWAISATVTPGMSLQTPSPFGICKAVQFFTVKGWINSGAPGNRKYDYGAMKLDCNVGLTTGFFGLAVQPSAALEKKSVSANGYYSNFDQEQGDGRVKEVASRQLFYSADTRHQMKGGPVWGLVDGCNDIACALAIHDGFDGPYNYGLRIVDPVFRNYLNWAGDGGIIF